LRKPEIPGKFDFVGPSGGGATKKEDAARFCDIWDTVWREKRFFIWIRRNPLISPDSAKEIQGNASFFAWFSLVLLG
jgi:hypothetical protein